MNIKWLLKVANTTMGHKLLHFSCYNIDSPNSLTENFTTWGYSCSVYRLIYMYRVVQKWEQVSFFL